MAFLLWNYVLSQHSPNEVTVFRLASPLVGLVAGWLLLSGEIVTWHLLVGGVLIVVGIWRVTR